MKLVYSILFFLMCLLAQSQEVTQTTYPSRAKIIDGDTLAIFYLPEINVVADRVFKNKKEEKRYDKLRRNVKKVYPYALIAEARLKEYNIKLSQIKTEAERKEYMKDAEKELMKEFEKDLRNLTFSQGKLLIKLIDRQTDKTSYQLVKQYRGGFSAFMWQSMARLFGANLKTEYDADGDDKKIEEIIHLIEIGEL